MFRRPLAAALLAVAALAAVSTFANAAPAPTEEQETVARVNRAIEQGKNYLKSRYAPNKHWESFLLATVADHGGGTTALATLALLTCGERPDAEPVRSALDFLRDLPPERTYVVGLVNMVLAEARRPADRTRIAANARWLIDHADRRGKISGWGYGHNKLNRADGSNTQYALLGLYAAKQAGTAIEPAVWEQLRDLYARTQKEDGPTTGYWRYIEEARDTPSFTMTAAGVSGLVIAGMGLGDSQQGLDPATGVAENCGRYVENDKLARGLNWVGKMFNWDGTPNSLGVWRFYNLYGIERVGRLSGQRFIGKVDWYRDGCNELTRTQRPDGSWSRDGGGFQVDGTPVLATSFALLFLSKGRTPVLVSKLAFGDFVMADKGVLVEKGGAGGVVDWNRKHNDARNLTDFASRELFNGLPLGWQVYDPAAGRSERNEDILAEVGTLVQSPVLYLTGHQRPKLGGQQKEIFKRYIEEGGFVLAEACCGSEEFADGFRALMEELFPDNVLKKMPPEHPVWSSFFAVPPTAFPKLECLERGCRTVVVFSPEPLAGFWEEAKYMPKGKEPAANRGQQAFRLGGNVVAYATGMEPPKQKLSFTRIVDASKTEKSPPGGFVKPAQLKLRDEPPPAPAAMRNLMGYLRDSARLDVVPDKEALSPGDDDLFKYRFLYLHGRKRFAFDDDEIANVKATLQNGGVLFADACCGSPAFDAAFREMVGKMFPGQKLELIPDNDDLYSERLNGVAIRTVKRREQAGGAGPDGGFKDLPPALEGIKVDGRWVVIYSKYDVGCALEGHKATDCLGHTRESALQLAAAAVLYSLQR